MDFIKMLILKHLTAFLLVLALLIVDCVTGITAALMEHNFRSAKMREGLSNKTKEIGFLLITYIADELTGIGAMELPITLSNIVTTYIVVMEIASFAENIGFILPESIQKLLPNSKTRR